MNFDNLMHYDLMNRLYKFIPFLLILIFWLWLYSLHYVTQWVNKFKIYSVESVSEESKKSNVEIVTWKGKAN